ncbi:DNA cytosine methyltransferase [Olsenella uli]|uniref:DNA cytosine methyltransferase n=1 Tax=Olsenella uli TaxID=133926 RepID=UPI001EEE54C5|nr:DNA cytosine methyltransferase [Olsenella uli]
MALDQLTYIDLFSGAGGLSEGLEQAGFHSLFASEIIPKYAETYAHNHPNAEVCIEDIRSIDPEDVRKNLGLMSETSIWWPAAHLVRVFPLTLQSGCQKTLVTTSFLSICDSLENLNPEPF